MQENETVDSKETPENENPQALGTSDDQTTGSEEVTEPEKSDEQSDASASPEELEKLRKELDQIKMERNMLKNKQDEERKKRLEDEGNFKQLAEEAQAELQRIKEEQEQRDAYEEAKSLRQKFIDEYDGDDKVKEAARALIAKNEANLSWGEASTEQEAKQQIHQQLDALKDVLGVTSEEGADDDISVHPNNPAINTVRPTSNKSAAELRKEYEAQGLIAPPR